INLWNWGIQNRTGRLRTIDRNILRLNVLPRGKATISRAGIKFKNLLYGSQRAMEEHWYLKLKNRSVNVVYDPRNIEKIYIPHDDGMGFETCILLEPSQQYKEDYLEEIDLKQKIRNELEKIERKNKIQLKENTEEAMEEIIKKAVKNKQPFHNQKTSKKDKKASIRDNKNVEKLVNREYEKFDLSHNKVN